MHVPGTGRTPGLRPMWRLANPKRSRVMECIREHRWSTWNPNFKSLASTHAEADGLWLGASCSGPVNGLAGTLAADIGVWWAQGSSKSSRVVSASFFVRPDWLKDSWVLPQPVAAKGISGNYRHISLPLEGNSPDLDAALNTLLGAIDACLTATAAPRT